MVTPNNDNISSFLDTHLAPLSSVNVFSMRISRYMRQILVLGDFPR